MGYNNETRINEHPAFEQVKCLAECSACAWKLAIEASEVYGLPSDAVRQAADDCAAIWRIVLLAQPNLAVISLRDVNEREIAFGVDQHAGQAIKLLSKGLSLVPAERW